KKMPESIRNMIIPPRNSATREPENKNTVSQTQEQIAVQVATTATTANVSSTDENSIRAQILAEQKARVSGINELFGMFGGRYQTLQA
ncbi:Clp protease ClpP, partial [Escherichia coli]|nr:Clp protease ClpP [Escherichia coli]